MAKKVFRILACLAAGCIWLCGCQRNEETATLVPAVGLEASVGLTQAEEDRGILYGDMVLDLGRQRVAYHTWEKGLASVSGYERHIVIEDLKEEKKLYIPYNSSIIRNMQIIDDSWIEIGFYRDGQEQTKYWQIPYGFFQEKELVFWENSLLLSDEGMDEAQAVESEIIWEKEIRINESPHTLRWERISRVYCDWKNIYKYDLADYRLTLFGEDGDIRYQEIVGGFRVYYEEVCWIKDITGNGSEDIIFCTYCLNNEYTELFFMAWTYKEKFEHKPLNKGMIRPQWNEKMGTLMFWSESAYYPDRHDMVMYRLGSGLGNWELYGKLMLDADDEPAYSAEGGIDWDSFYEEWKPYKREIFYDNGKVIQDEISDKGWFDEDSIWYRENPDNLKLFPMEDWEIETVVLSTGEEVRKYVNAIEVYKQFLSGKKTAIDENKKEYRITDLLYGNNQRRRVRRKE